MWAAAALLMLATTVNGATRLQAKCFAAIVDRRGTTHAAAHVDPDAMRFDVVRPTGVFASHLACATAIWLTDRRPRAATC
jgi:hypothetical protein